MKAVTWKPGTNQELDQLFDEYREIQFHDNHHLAKNYSRHFYDFSIALTIAFDENDKPEICSSISSRDCWPKGAYRIMSRLWKTKHHRVQHSTFISQAMIGNALSQIAFLKEHTDCRFYFISREKNGWQDWSIKKFKKQFDVDFKIASGKYLTCPNESDSSCWQHIIYQGDETVFSEWKSINERDSKI